MSNAKRTPGPWTLNPYAADYEVVSSDAPDHIALRMMMLEVHGKGKFKALSIGNIHGQIAIIPLDESSEANAKLIAAAPDMAEALKFYADPETYNRRFDVGIGTTTDLMKDNEGDIARAALAKAGME